MAETRYFIFNHNAAFHTFLLDGATLSEDCLILGDSSAFIAPVMDCGERGAVWRRLLADIELPANSRITWRLFASDSEIPALNEVLANGGISVGEKLAFLNRFEAFSLDNATDFLPLGVQGRYAVLYATLSLPPGSRPAVLRSLRLYSGWESFLPYLPEIFRDDGGFLDRFLRLFSAPYLDMEAQIEALPDTLDPNTAPPDSLLRLAEIIGIPHVNLWQTENLRKLLVSGTYRRKGRFSALSDFIEQFTGFRPYVTENFRQMTGLPENDTLYKGSDLNLFLPPESSDADLNMEAVNMVLKSFLPAGVTYRLQILDVYPVISGYAYLGVNTRLGSYSEAVLGVNSRLNFVVLGGYSHVE